MHALTKLFRTLRQQGFSARQSYKCCSSCALSAFERELPKMSPKPRGFVYYHQQDAEHLKARPERFVNETKCPTLQLRFVSVGDDGRSMKKVGTAVAKALKECGLPFEWDGDPACSIEVYPFGKTKKRGEDLVMLGAS